MLEFIAGLFQKKIVIARNAKYMLRRLLSKPRIDVLKRLSVTLLKTAYITAVDQNITLRDRDLSMPSMCIS